MIHKSTLTSTVAATLMLASLGAGAASAQTTSAESSTPSTSSMASTQSTSSTASTSSQSSTSSTASTSSKTSSSTTSTTAIATPEITNKVTSSTGDYIQTGTTVDADISYTGLIAGDKYRLEARLMCKDTGADTKATQSHEFTSAQDKGSEIISALAVTDPDCSTQVVFTKLYDHNNQMIASHEDLDDKSSTIGGDSMLKKKDKKDGEGMTTSSDPTSRRVVPSSPSGPLAQANSKSNANATPVGVAGSTAPRQVITSVPSGNTSDYGIDLFHR